MPLPALAALLPKLMSLMGGAGATGATAGATGGGAGLQSLLGGMGGGQGGGNMMGGQMLKGLSPMNLMQGVIGSATGDRAGQYTKDAEGYTQVTDSREIAGKALKGNLIGAIGDAMNRKSQMKKRERDIEMGKAAHEKMELASSPYANPDSPYYSAAEGGAFVSKYLSPEHLMMLNNNNTNTYAMKHGGNYGNIDGAGGPKDDAILAQVQPGAHVVPYEKVPDIKATLYDMGVNPNREYRTGGANGANAKVSDDEFVMSPEITRDVKRYLNIGEAGIEKMFHPNSPYNKYVNANAGMKMYQAGGPGDPEEPVLPSDKSVLESIAPKEGLFGRMFRRGNLPSQEQVAGLEGKTIETRMPNLEGVNFVPIDPAGQTAVGEDMQGLAGETVKSFTEDQVAKMREELNITDVPSDKYKSPEKGMYDMMYADYVSPTGPAGAEKSAISVGPGGEVVFAGGKGADTKATVTEDLLKKSKGMETGEKIAQGAMALHNLSKKFGAAPPPSFTRFPSVKRDYQRLFKTGREDIERVAKGSARKLKELGQTDKLVGLTAEEMAQTNKLRSQVEDMRQADNIKQALGSFQAESKFMDAKYRHTLSETMRKDLFADKKGAAVSKNIGEFFATGEAGLQREADLRGIGAEHHEIDSKTRYDQIFHDPEFARLRKEKGYKGISPSEWSSWSPEQQKTFVDSIYADSETEEQKLQRFLMVKQWILTEEQKLQKLYR